MARLKVIQANANTEILFNEIMVMNEGEKSEYYIDPRTTKNESDLNVVKPVVWLGGYWYVCPDCGQLHKTDMVGCGKIQTGCCLDIDCERHQYLDGKHFVIKKKTDYI